MNTSPFLVAAALCFPALAQPDVTPVCYQGFCADGYAGCGCDEECCRLRLERAGHGKSGPASASDSGYGAEAAMLQVFMQMTFQAVRQMQRQKSSASSQYPEPDDPMEVERRRISEMQRQLAEKQKAERRRQEFEAYKAQATARMKGKPPPDLSKLPDFKNSPPSPSGTDGADSPDISDPWAKAAFPEGPLGDALRLSAGVEGLQAKGPRLTGKEVQRLYDLQWERSTRYRALSEDEKREYVRIVADRERPLGSDAARAIRLGSGDLTRYRGLAPEAEEATGPWRRFYDDKPAPDPNKTTWERLRDWAKDKASQPGKALSRTVVELSGGSLETEREWQ